MHPSYDSAHFGLNLSKSYREHKQNILVVQLAFWTFRVRMRAASFRPKWLCSSARLAELDQIADLGRAMGESVSSCPLIALTKRRSCRHAKRGPLAPASRRKA